MSRDELARGTMLAFGLQSGVGAAMALLLAVYLTKFYVDVVLLPAGVMAVAIAAGRAFDAITDPIMGWVSDRTRTRFGRRLPWIAVGVAGNAVMFTLLLNPPQALPQAGLVGWAAGALVLAFLFLTMVLVPREALAVELTQNQRQRQALFGAIAGFVAVGAIVGAVMPNLLAALGVNDERAKMTWQSVIYVGAYLAVNGWFLARVRERPEYVGRGHVPLVPGVRRMLRNRPFRILFISHIITAIPIVIPATLLPFYTQYVLGADLAWVGYFLLAYLLAGLAALPIWLRIAAARGKLTVWMAAAFIAVSGGASLFFLGPGDQGKALLLHLYVGVQSTVWLFVGGAMHADVVDYDELHTGKRREAQFSALWSIIPKFALTPGAAIPMAILGGVGYVPSAETQSPDVVLSIRILYALVPATLNAIGLSIMAWYPLSEARHTEIRAAIARHAQGESVVDPITGEPLPPPDRRSVDEETAWLLDSFSITELGRIAEGGARRVRAQILAQAAAWLAVTAALLAGLFATLDSLEREPGPIPSLLVVAAGLTFTAALFHAARLPAAGRLMEQPVAPAILHEHIDAVRRAAGSARLVRPARPA